MMQLAAGAFIYYNLVKIFKLDALNEMRQLFIRMKAERNIHEHKNT